MPVPLHALPPSGRTPESAAERRARQLDMLREMAELAMTVARTAAAKAADPAPAPAGTPDPGLTFARATRAARQAIALETRIAAGTLAPVRHIRPAGVPADPRRPLLRQTLRRAATGDPALRREVDEAIELELAADPEAEIAAVEILAKLADQLGLSIDPGTLPDDLLGLAPITPPRHDPANAADPNPPALHAPALHAPALHPTAFHPRE